MEDMPYRREFFLKLDRDYQKIVDGLYNTISEINYYKNDCRFELPEHLKKLQELIFETLRLYEENNL